MPFPVNDKNKYYVYAIVDPINRVPIYIGKGSGDRAHSHLRVRAKHHNRELAKYIELLRALETEPEVGFIAEGLEEKDAWSIEYECILLAESRGMQLTNIVGVPRNRINVQTKLNKGTKVHSQLPWNKGKRGVQIPWNKGKRGLQIAWNKGITTPSYTRTQVVCPHCNKSGANSVMYRWHFDNCKLLKS
jgi:hypothetical protein